MNPNDMSKFNSQIVEYEKALSILDAYDHQTLVRPKGTKELVKVSYEECRNLINSMHFNSPLFGVEKDQSFHSSINAIYQSAFGEDIYKTTEEKAANLLYLIVKNHSFLDGNKRIAVSIFLYFLFKNNLLSQDGKKRMDDIALVNTTIFIAMSNPAQKEVMIDLIINLLN